MERCGGVDIGCGCIVGQLGGLQRQSSSNAVATFIGNAPTGLRDLAYRPGDAMYGTNGIDQLWRDSNGDGIPDTLIGGYGLGTGDHGLAFDRNGDLLVYNVETDMIYKGTGADPTSLVGWVNTGPTSSFSHGLYASGETGFHSWYDVSGTFRDSPNYTFSTTDSSSNASYTDQGIFPLELSGVSSVLVGGLTATVPEPSALTLGILFTGAMLIRRRRRSGRS